jgi:predicted ATPase/tetratricopeptide (TPR) repeat protein
MPTTPPFRGPPAKAGPLVGRSTELARILEALSAGERLVTLKGPGGIGKTRMALEAAPRIGDFVWCDLTFARTEDDAWRAIAASIGPDLLEPHAILAALGRRTLVLDNLESVDAGPTLVTAILRGAPEAKLLVATREATNAPGERIIELPPLDIASDAMTLFLQHAGRRDPPLLRSSENTASILALLQAVDGIPLAIELAARRASVLGVDAVLARLSEGIGILSRPGADRHASLERTIDESFRALDDAEKAAFVDAAVFRGGFSLDAASAVLEGNVPDLLHSLADKSLLWLDEPGGRFRMHQVIRDVALERGKERLPKARARHAAWFIDWVERVRSPAGVIPSRAERETVLAEAENLRAAAEHALASGDPVGCVRALAGLAPALRIHGDSHWWSELRDKARPFDSQLPPGLLARLELVETLMVSLRGRRDEAEASAARLATSTADPEVRLAASILHVQQLLDRGDAEAASTVAAPSGPVHPALDAEWALVRVQTLDPARPETLAALEDASGLALRLEDATLLAATARVTASLELARGNVTRARASLERERSIAEAAELRPVLAQNLLRLGCCDMLEGNLDAATERFEAAELAMGALALRGRIPRAKLLLGLLWIERGDPARAEALFDEAAMAAEALRIRADAPIQTVGRALALHMLGRGAMPVLPEPDMRLWASPSADVDRVLRAVVRRTFANGLPLRLETDAESTWFSTGGERVDLSDRDSLRNVLRALLDARGGAVESAVLIAAGWPGERIREDAARNRLRVAIAMLRKLGLEAIETAGTTYRLRAVVIRR